MVSFVFFIFSHTVTQKKKEEEIRASRYFVFWGPRGSGGGIAECFLMKKEVCPNKLPVLKKKKKEADPYVYSGAPAFVARPIVMTQHRGQIIDRPICIIIDPLRALDTIGDFSVPSCIYLNHSSISLSYPKLLWYYIYIERELGYYDYLYPKKFAYSSSSIYFRFRVF